MRRLGHILLMSLTVLVLIAAVSWWWVGPYVTAAIDYRNTPQSARTIGDQAHLSREGGRFYYGSQPRVVDKPRIQKACAQVASEGLLGCYTGRIYLLDVTDPQFKAEMGVTAAHEMLHAVYAHFGTDERKRVDALLSAELDKRKDPKLNDRLNKYQDRESQLDEAFAILGSEAPGNTLQPALLKVFDRYFTDREAVVAVNTRFQQAFDQLEAKINGLNDQLAQRKRQLDGLLAEDNIAAYNAQVNPYNALVNEHNELVRQYNDLGQRFNRAIGATTTPAQ